MTSTATPTSPPNRLASARGAAFAAPRTLLVAALLACYLVWGSTYLAIRFALTSLPPFLQMGSRFLAAGGLLMLWCLWRGHALPTRRQWLHASIVGTLMLGAMGLLGEAERSIGSGLIAAFIAIVPLLVAGLGLLFGRRPSRGEWVGMALGFAGVLLLMRGASFAAAPAALVCIVAATSAWSLGSVLSTSKLPLAPGAPGFASEMLCGGAVLMLLSLVLGEKPAWPIAPEAAFAWVYLVVFGSIVAFSAYLYLLANASPALATSYAFVNPVIALALGVSLGGEQVSRGEWLASGVVLAGVAIVIASRAKHAANAFSEEK